MGVSTIVVKRMTFITSRRRLLLLVLHQKAPPQSRISTSAAVVPPIELGFAALFPGNFKTTPGTEKSILQVYAPLVSTASRVAVKNNWFTVTNTYSDRRSNKKKTEESAGDIDYLVDFASSSHHHCHDQLGHISAHSVTFRCVTTSASNPLFRVRTSSSWACSTTTPVTPICPIRTFTSFSSGFKAGNNINMSNAIGEQQIIDGQIQDMRKPYRQDSDTFDIKDLASRDPITQFGSWFQDACKHPDIKEPNAIALATASRSGQPSVRMVLLKEFSKDGFKIFTNVDSRKGKELMENPLCSVCIHWEPLNRSVRIEGKVTRLPEEESCHYFNTRPRPSQLGAIVSNQSSIIPSREYLMDKFSELEKKYESEEVIPKPDSWGGYLIKPEVIEFWQGQTTRIHDRLRFRRKEPNEVLDPELTHEGEDGWVIERLSP